MFIKVVTYVVAIINIKIGVYTDRINQHQNMLKHIINFMLTDAIVIFLIL